MTHPFIYESVLITSRNHRRTIELFELYRTNKETDPCRFIRRLGLSCSDDWPQGHKETLQRDIVDVLTRCRVLEIYRHSERGEKMADVVVRTLLEHCGHTLRQLDLRKCVLPENSLNVLSKACKLRILLVSGCFIQHDAPRAAPASLPAVHTISIDQTMTGALGTLFDSKYPNLQCIIVHGIS